MALLGLVRYENPTPSPSGYSATLRVHQFGGTETDPTNWFIASDEGAMM
jgi:hypothetical protein